MSEWIYITKGTACAYTVCPRLHPSPYLYISLYLFLYLCLYLYLSLFLFLFLFLFLCCRLPCPMRSKVDHSRLPQLPHSVEVIVCRRNVLATVARIIFLVQVQAQVITLRVCISTSTSTIHCCTEQLHLGCTYMPPCSIAMCKRGRGSSICATRDQPDHGINESEDVTRRYCTISTRGGGR